MRFTGNMVGGIILLILGAVLLLSNILGFKVNLFRLFPGTILLILGVLILFGQFGSRHEVIFDSKKIDLSQPFGEKNIIFGEGVLDLNDLTEINSAHKMKMNVIFSSGQLILNPSIPTIINGSTVFGYMELPQRTVSFIGSTEFQTGNIQRDKPYVELEVNVIFGQLRVLNP